MKIIILGNAGSGKSTLAKKLSNQDPKVALLSLDQVAFQYGAQRRPVAESITEIRNFIVKNPSWVIEGCYADLCQAILPDCNQLIFLNPGVEACVTHCRARPWEPDKFSSSIEQEKQLEYLIDWVRNYTSRDDEYGLKQHRELFATFQGSKCEYTEPHQYESGVTICTPQF